MSESRALAAALRADRERYNALFARARQGSERLTPEVFSAWLREVLAPISDRVAAAAPERIGDTLDALYPMSLELLRQGWAGPEARSRAIERVWRELLPAIPGLLAQAPEMLAARLSNAARRLEEATLPVGDWLVMAERAAARAATLEAFLGAARVAAWRMGLATERSAALQALHGLDGPLAAAALGLETMAFDVAALAAALGSNPWTTPEALLAGAPLRGELSIVRRAGAFRGFGGRFIAPPLVFSVEAGILAFDGEAAWGLCADAFGAAFVRAGAAPPTGLVVHDDVAVSSNGTVRIGRLKRTFPELAEPTSFACDGVTVAVTVSWSHGISLVAAT